MDFVEILYKNNTSYGKETEKRHALRAGGLDS